MENEITVVGDFLGPSPTAISGNNTNKRPHLHSIKRHMPKPGTFIHHHFGNKIYNEKFGAVLWILFPGLAKRIDVTTFICDGNLFRNMC